MRIAQSPEGRRIFPRMTVFENLQMGASLDNLKHFDEDVVTLLILRLSPFLVSEEFAAMVGGWVAEGVGVEFERVGPPGHLPAKMRMNELLEDAVATQDLRAMHKIFAWSLAHIDKTHAWERDPTEFHSQLS